jgi:uncharacterized protein (TIGR03067 family)
MSVLLFSLALAVGAPALKDPPLKGAAVVGRWQATAVISNGSDINQHMGLEYEFTTDGHWLIYRGGQILDGTERTYAADAKARPAAIDLTEQPKPYPGVFAVETDTLTVCFRTDGGQRPAAVEARGHGLMTVVLTRVKTKD